MAAPCSDHKTMHAKRVSNVPSHGRNYVREWRKFRGLTQEALAEASGYSAATISQLETGAQGYEEATLVRLSEALDCHPSDLIAGPPQAGALMSEIRSLPIEHRDQIIEALQEMLAKLKRIGHIPG